MKDAELRISNKKFKKLASIIIGLRFQDVKDLKKLTLIREKRK